MVELEISDLELQKSEITGNLIRKRSLVENSKFGCFARHAS
jgi:hypothetical protein